MAQILTFEPENHVYRLDGEIIPSVTQIVEPLGSDIDENMELVFEAAAERGTTCHKILELLLQGEQDIEYPSSYEPHMEAIQKFLSEHTIIPLAIETPIHSNVLGIAGTPDILCEFDGNLAILDYKFVAQVAKTKVKAQLNGYLKMFNELGVFPEKLGAIQFLNTGDYRIYPVAIDETEFMLCYQLYQLKNKKHSRGRID